MISIKNKDILLSFINNRPVKPEIVIFDRYYVYLVKDDRITKAYRNIENILKSKNIEYISIYSNSIDYGLSYLTKEEIKNDIIIYENNINFNINNDILEIQKIKEEFYKTDSDLDKSIYLYKAFYNAESLKFIHDATTKHFNKEIDTALLLNYTSKLLIMELESDSFKNTINIYKDKGYPIEKYLDLTLVNFIYCYENLKKINIELSLKHYLSNFQYKLYFPALLTYYETIIQKDDSIVNKDVFLMTLYKFSEGLEVLTKLNLDKCNICKIRNNKDMLEFIQKEILTNYIFNKDLKDIFRKIDFNNYTEKELIKLNHLIVEIFNDYLTKLQSPVIAFSKINNYIEDSITTAYKYFLSKNDKDNYKTIVFNTLIEHKIYSSAFLIYKLDDEFKNTATKLKESKEKIYELLVVFIKKYHHIYKNSIVSVFFKLCESTDYNSIVKAINSNCYKSINIIINTNILNNNEGNKNIALLTINYAPLDTIRYLNTNSLSDKQKNQINKIYK